MIILDIVIVLALRGKSFCRFNPSRGIYIGARSRPPHLETLNGRRSRALMAVSIVGPSRSEPAVIVKRAYIRPLAPHAEHLCGTYCEAHCLIAAGGSCTFGRRALNDPHIAIAYDIVSAFRHDLLLQMWSQRQTRLLTRCVERSEMEERDYIRDDRAHGAKTEDKERAPIEWILGKHRRKGRRWMAGLCVWSP